MNNLARGPLGDATYQISRIYALRFQTRRCFHVLPYIRICKTCDPRAGHFWPKGHDLKKKLVEVHEVMLHTCTKYQGSMPYGFRQETFFMF